MLLASPGRVVTFFVGLPLLLHLGYQAVTSLPAGRIPGRPSGRAEKRRNYRLRARVRSFLTEVQRAETYVQRARAGKLPRSEVKRNLHVAEKRIMASAQEVVRATGRMGD
ncbi:MAG: hypothetical protein ACLFWG_03050 [Longimicrobiales bacterium]